MKNKLAMLFLILACLFIFICGIVQIPEEMPDTTETTEETVLVTIIPTVDTIAPTTEIAIQETTEATAETTIADPPVIEPTVAVEPQITEQPTEPEEPDGGLRSLGTFKLTAYCSCQKCCGKYALNRPIDEYGNEIVYGSIGVRLTAGISIAVDPSVISYGSQVVINGHTYTAHDTGGNIKGNRIDVYFDSHQEALRFGVQYAEVFVYA